MIVVTGGAGFIGSNLIAALQARGERDIVAVDRLGADDKWRNLAKRDLADIVAPEDLSDLIAANHHNISMIFHMGAISSTTERDVDLIVANNWRCSFDLWRQAAQYDLRLVYASSAATYGDGAQGFDDDPAPTALDRLTPLNPYAWSKLLFDKRVAQSVENREHLPTQWAGLRFFNVYGPNENHKGNQRSVVPQFYAQIAKSGVAKLFKSYNAAHQHGGQQRDFIHVDDTVAVMLWLMDNPQVSGLFNVGTGTARSFIDVARAIFSALNTPPDIEFVEMPEALRAHYQYFTKARTDRLRAAGFTQDFISVEQGVADYVTRYLTAADPYR